jgi:hypothetical protein
MFSRRQFEGRRQLALAEMEMMLIFGDALTRRDKVGIDQNVQVTGVFV